MGAVKPIALTDADLGYVAPVEAWNNQSAGKLMAQVEMLRAQLKYLARVLPEPWLS